MESTIGKVFEVSKMLCENVYFAYLSLHFHSRLPLKEAKSLGIDVPASALENLENKTG